MSSQGFSFPPPPPPPPPLPAQQAPADPQARHGQNRGGRDLDTRGRGRGQGSRGRGGNHARGGRAPSYPAAGGFNFTQPNYGGYPQALPPAPYMTPSPYHPGQTIPFQPQSFPQPVAQGNYLHPHNPQNPTPYQPHQFPQLAATGSYPHNTTPGYPPPDYMKGLPAPHHGHQPNNHAVMGSVPWHNRMQGAGSYMGAQPGQALGPRPPHGNQGLIPPQSHKRDHSSAFKKQPTVPRTPAAPAVPSFGNPLPSKPPLATDLTAGKAKRRRRKHNQLGLTPQANDESSEDEVAEDEESKLAQSVSETAPLQVSYKGQTSKLATPSDIAAWIAERKKKFPTQARIEEKKKAVEEAKAARDAARPQKNKKEHKKRKDHGQKQSGSNANSAPDLAMNDEQRRETIQRDLAREEQRILDAMAETNAARLRVEALRREALSLNGGVQQDQSITPAVKTEPDDATSEPATKVELEAPMLGPVIKPEPHATIPDTSIPENPIKVEHLSHSSLDGPMDLDPDIDDGASDWTSSSGSDSDSDSNSDSDGSAPEQVSSRRTGPERVPPPPREGKKTVCRYFARNGHCNRGDQCKFSHDNDSERSSKAKTKQPEKKDKDPRRKGLYQALLDRQQEDDDRRAMEVILWLGQNNVLALNQGS
ncbi:hypothetical protein N7457_004607 [Penicillium paradoxum]|uniref:uncharacterized protein n=1 Tax=Penicillium paradoxum TaxID=176176 RepID=UPI002548B013|nr:uncharacterized protein N7457_004607 [Penicillium paradoxum]KAJ5782833.1 hypothetical protein N7457_004607 [Penicillium paradoxum]